MKNRTASTTGKCSYPVSENMGKRSFFRAKSLTIAWMALTLLTNCVNVTKSRACFRYTSTLTSASNQVSAATLCPGAVKAPIYGFSIAIGGPDDYWFFWPTLTKISFATTNAAADVARYQLWWNTTNNLSGAVQLGSNLTSSLGTGWHTFDFCDKTLSDNTTYYFWITADVSIAATGGNTIKVAAMVNSCPNIYYGIDPWSATGSACAGNTQTISVVPRITSTLPASRCGSGTVTLHAVSNAGTVKWYTASLGGTLLATGSSYTTGSLSASATYYAEAYNNGCLSASRTAVTATVGTGPTAAPSNSGPVCAGGGVNLSANPGLGTSYYFWSGPGSWSSTQQNPSATPTVTTTYSLTVSSAGSGCTNSTVYKTTVIVNARPAVNPATDGPICAGTSASLHANASGGAGNYSYLWTGPGLFSSTLACPVVAPGLTSIYSLSVTSNGSGCISTIRPVTVTVNALPSVFSVSGGGAYCSGTAGIHIGLSSSNPGINYQLVRAGTLVKTINGAGTLLDFGSFAVPGTYSITAVDTATSCVSVMSGAATISVNPAPGLYMMTGGGSYCIGGEGVSVGLAGSERGCTYQLYNGAMPMGDPVLGTGEAIDFGLQTMAGSCYWVLAKNATGCSGNMTGSVGVTINLLPWDFSVTGGGSYCPGGSVAVGLYSSVSYTNYQLFLNGSPIGSAVPGTGTTIAFGRQTEEGIYTVIATNTLTGCVGRMSGNAQVSVSSMPTVFVTTGGGGYCMGDAGVHVGISGSDTGTIYQLYRGIASIGDFITGTGNALDFGMFTTEGTYKIKAINLATGCASDMAGSAAIIANTLPEIYSVTGGGGYCTGGSGVHVGLNNSTSAVSYQLFKGSIATGEPLTGTGYSLDFGLQAKAGQYTVAATDPSTHCLGNMSGQAIVSVNPLPLAYTVAGGGSYCAGDAGVMVKLVSTEYGVNYQLTNSGVALGEAVPGTGVILNFGIQTTAGIYSVVGTNAATGCSSAMENSVTITVDALPNVYAMTGGGSYCEGSAGVAIGLANSQEGIVYQLYNRIANLDTGSLSGNGGVISFGSIKNAGIYSVIGIDMATGCSDTMSGYETVSINTAPAEVSVIGGGSYCSGDSGVHIGLPGSCVGINYQLYRDAAAVGLPLAGVGYNLDFGLQTVAGSYRVIATNIITGCTTTMPDIAEVLVNEAPAISADYNMVAPLSMIPLNASPAGGIWSSSAALIAVVDSEGNVTGMSAGTSIISYTMPTGCFATQIVSVNAAGYKAAPQGDAAPGLSSADINVLISPNPSRGVFTVKGTIAASENEQVYLEMTNMSGQVVCKQSFPADGKRFEQHVQPENIANGMYLLLLRTKNSSKVFKISIYK